MTAFVTYFRYFLYLGFHWNWKIAYTLLREEIKGEKKYGIFTTGADELNQLKASGTDISHATIYMPVSYGLLEQALNFVQPGKHFVDIGCGKGRAICVAAQFGFDAVTGIDFSHDLCALSLLNLQLTFARKPDFSYAIAETNAADYAIPEDADCLFLFNPFDETVMQRVVNNIEQSFQQHPRNLHVIYANPLYKHCFLRAGFEEVFYDVRLKYLEVSILQKKGT